MEIRIKKRLRGLASGLSNLSRKRQAADSRGVKPHIAVSDDGTQHRFVYALMGDPDGESVLYLDMDQSHFRAMRDLAYPPTDE